MTGTEYVKGRTYPVRAQMRALGGEWDQMTKCWVFTSHQKATEARAIVAGQPKGGRKCQ